MSGSISEFDDAKREEIASHVASELGVQLSQVTVQVEAASVKISVKVEYDSQPGAVAGSKSLPVALTTSTIGVDPLAISISIAVEGAAPPWAPPLPALPPPTAPGSKSALVIGTICGGVVLMVLSIWFFFMQKKRTSLVVEPAAVTHTKSLPEVPEKKQMAQEMSLRKRSSSNLIESFRRQSSAESLKAVSAAGSLIWQA